jgi:flap endonuclease-1
MAVDLRDIVSKRAIEIEELNGKSIAIDAYNVFYQFLSIIRQPDGTPLMDDKGSITSHLSGLFYRNTELISKGITPIYVFDGLPSVLKQKTINARMQRKREAQAAWKEAVEKGDIEAARAKAQQTVRMTKEIVESGKALLGLMGIPCINAPSEGEAQASHMCAQGQVYAVGSQDYDTMLFGAPAVVRNLTISGKRKLPGKNVYVNVSTELLNFKDTLEKNGITHRQLIWTGILLGTDFNEGVKGVGPKTALKIVKSAKKIEDVKAYVKQKYNYEFELDIEEVEHLFMKPEVKDITGQELDSFSKLWPNKEGIISFMCAMHGFSEDRIEKYTDKLMELKGHSAQKTISNWFK